MKNIAQYRYRGGPTPLAFVCLIASFGLVPRSYSAAPAETNPEPKTHTLFMGADFDLERNKEFYRAQGVSGASFIIKVAGRDVLVPMDQGPVNLKVKQELKLTQSSATISDLVGERAYTPANDPGRKAVAAQMLAMSGPTAGDIAIKANNQVFLAGVLGRGVEGGVIPNEQHEEFKQHVAESESGYNAAVSGSGAMTRLGTNMSGRLQGDAASEPYDAMDITFQISSPVPISSPYVVIVAQYRGSNEKPGTVHNWVYAKELDAVDSQPRKVRIMRGGFPPGFQLEKFRVHLYNHGRELATNVADKQVPLTRDEAFQFVLLDYLGSHKEATTPAMPALGRLSPEDRSRLSGGQLMQTFFVKVNKDGLAETAYLDEACSRQVDDPYTQTLIKNVRFKPALVKGQPVEGVAQLKLNELTL